MLRPERTEEKIEETPFRETWCKKTQHLQYSSTIII